METGTIAKPVWWKRWRGWNWWKIGFFTMLVLFEFAREWAVMASFQEARPSAMAYVSEYGGSVHATGAWKRTDRDEKLMPVAVTIDCRAETGKCLEAYSTMDELHVSSPELDWFDAKFTPDGVSYDNDFPKCVSYSVKIDTKLKQVFAVRQKKEGVTDELCEQTENRLEMKLVDGWQLEGDKPENHFVPLFQLLIWVLKPIF